jgi:hypothetical protein
MILEKNNHERVFEVRSASKSDKFYTVDADIKTCTCPDFNFRYVKCKHILHCSRQVVENGSRGDLLKRYMQPPARPAWLRRQEKGDGLQALQVRQISIKQTKRWRKESTRRHELDETGQIPLAILPLQQSLYCISKLL